MYYVYILKQNNADHFYVGSTNDLKKRIKQHQEGLTRSTQGREWELYCYFAFQNEQICRNFEKYLKGGSGRSFSKKHFGFKLKQER